MSVCIVYLASPSAFLIPEPEPRRRYEALKYSMTRTRILLPTLPIVVFHEDYTKEDIDGLGYTGATFVKVDFRGFDDVYRRVNASKGYMMMCRFFSGVLQAHPELQKYSHYIRLDDDSYFLEPYITEKRISTYLTYDYVYRSVFYEAKQQQTLFDFTLKFLERETRMNIVDMNYLRATLRNENVIINGTYSGKAPYNNFHVSSLRLWTHPLVAKYIRAIESVHGCLHHGWLDANVHAMIIWVVAKRIPGIRVTSDTEFGYRHNAHVSVTSALNVVIVPNLKFIPCDEEDTRPTPSVDLKLPGKLIFATFANTSYMSTSRIEEQAREFGVFDEIRGCTERTLPEEFFDTHKEFIKSNPIGYGRWIWKPKLVQTLLASMQDNDILVYCDAGMYLNRRGLPRFAEYVQHLTSGASIVAFSLNDNYLARHYACPDAVASYFPAFYDTPHRYCYAGVFLMKKTPDSLSLVNDWLAFCETYPYLLGESTATHPDYRGGDSDNGLFNICLAKYDSSVARVYPDETSVYFPNGDQFYNCPDWSSLKDFPFQCRRIRPRRVSV
jgi:hypothetical protein